MLTLWRWVSLRHLFGEGARTLLTLLGVALGVAVFVSIRLANHSAMSAFAETVNTVAGKANLQVVADSEGFDERVFPAVRALPGVEAAAPVVQTYALAGRGAAPGQRTFSAGEKAPYKETLLVMGIDLFSERPFERYKPQGEGNLEALTFLTDPRAVAVTRTLADRLALKPGGPLTLLAGGRPVTLTVRQVLDSPELQGAMGGNVVFTDIATAQEVFSRYGKLDRIDLRVDPARKEEVTAALRALLPPQARAAQPQGRTRQVENMV
ncbi:MAG TPA: ABC transporter permease, partial [Armatimonadota bacterium]|nr:ABC transporter permease [Armatimonadota bacterium]